MHLRLGKHALAEPLLRERLTIYEQKQPNAWQRYDTMSKLGGCLAVARKFEQAEPLLLGSYEGLKLRTKAKGVEATPVDRITAAAERLVQLYELWGKNDKAAQCRKQLELHKQARFRDSKSEEK
jgi:hypothetical protein